MTAPQFRITVLGVLVIAVGGIGYGIWHYQTTPGAYDQFASCLGEKGAKFYGAFWCPHCAAQKKIFGKSAKKLPYIECAIPGNQSAMTQECKDAQVEGYPTWVFADGSRVTGEQSLSILADRTSCTLPEQQGS